MRLYVSAHDALMSILVSQAGDAAQNLVAQVQPKWSTSEATVCVGPFTINVRKKDAFAAPQEDHSASEEDPSAFDSDW